MSSIVIDFGELKRISSRSEEVKGEVQNTLSSVNNTLSNICQIVDSPELTTNNNALSSTIKTMSSSTVSALERIKRFLDVQLNSYTQNIGEALEKLRNLITTIDGLFGGETSIVNFGLTDAGAVAAIDSAAFNNLQYGSGETITIPDNVKQTGIIANATQNYSTRGWAYNQGMLADAYKAAGSQADGNMATLNGRYLVAVSPTFGTVGDNIDIQLENGQVIPAIIADIKGADATSPWGHQFPGGAGVDVIEWEINGSANDGGALRNNLTEKGWYGSDVTSIINFGSGNYF